MPMKKSDRPPTKKTISESCIPLLFGSERTVRKTAFRLFRTYRVRSYALLPEGGRVPLLSRLCLTVIPTTCASPSLLADLAVRFFAGLDSSALPVLIDCSTDGLFLQDPALRSLLEPHCFLSGPDRLDEIPPFCYLSRKEKEERSVPPC